MAVHLFKKSKKDILLSILRIITQDEFVTGCSDNEIQTKTNYIVLNITLNLQ